MLTHQSTQNNPVSCDTKPKDRKTGKKIIHPHLITEAVNSKNTECPRTHNTRPTSSQRTQEMTNGVCQRTLPLYSSYVEKRTTPEKPLCQNETTAVRSQTLIKPWWVSLLLWSCHVAESSCVASLRRVFLQTNELR